MNKIETRALRKESKQKQKIKNNTTKYKIEYKIN